MKHQSDSWYQRTPAAGGLLTPSCRGLGTHESLSYYGVVSGPKEQVSKKKVKHTHTHTYPGERPWNKKKRLYILES
jgi:hypothetical protein